MATFDLDAALAPRTFDLTMIREAVQYRAQSGVIQAEDRPGDRWGLRLSWPALSDERRRALLALFASLGRSDAATGERNRVRINMAERLRLAQSRSAANPSYLIVTAEAVAGARQIDANVGVADGANRAPAVGDLCAVGTQLCIIEALDVAGNTVDVWPPLYSTKAVNTRIEYVNPTGVFEMSLEASQLAVEQAAAGTLSESSAMFEQAVY